MGTVSYSHSMETMAVFFSRFDTIHERDRHRTNTARRHRPRLQPGCSRAAKTLNELFFTFVQYVRLVCSFILFILLYFLLPHVW